MYTVRNVFIEGLPASGYSSEICFRSASKSETTREHVQTQINTAPRLNMFKSVEPRMARDT